MMSHGRNIVLALLLTLMSPMTARAQDSSSPAPNVNSAQNQPAPATGDADGEMKPQTPDTDLFALMTGTCSTLKIAGRDFACRTVAYSHSVQGRAYFTIALDDPNDPSHIVSFSGDSGKRSHANLYDLPTVWCSATDRSGKRYDLRFESDGSPITVRRVNPSAPNIRERG